MLIKLKTKRRFSGDLSEMYSIPGMFLHLLYLCNSNAILVPGLVNDPVQGVQRGKFSLNGSEVAQIFKPVLDEIITLVKGQVASTNRTVKAVLLVGGFGESPYLRESLRTAVGSGVEILVPANRLVYPLYAFPDL